MMKKACNVLGKMWLGGTAVVGLWLLASWVDVVTHNLDTNPVYQSWNLFAILIGINQGSVPSNLRGRGSLRPRPQHPQTPGEHMFAQKEQQKNFKKNNKFFS